MKKTDVVEEAEDRKRRMKKKQTKEKDDEKRQKNIKMAYFLPRSYYRSYRVTLYINHVLQHNIDPVIW